MTCQIWVIYKIKNKHRCIVFINMKQLEELLHAVKLIGGYEL